MGLPTHPREPRTPKALPPWDFCLHDVHRPLAHGIKKPRVSQADSMVWENCTRSPKNCALGSGPSDLPGPDRSTSGT